jgi:Ni2+-binding GTPase involved in maturation of urease and hydrogenase
MRHDRPFVFTNLKTGSGIETVMLFIEERGGLNRRGHNPD